MDEIKEIIQLTGSGVAGIALWIGYTVYRDLRGVIERNTLAIQAMRLAIVAGNPKAADAIERFDSELTGKARSV